ncbi:WD-40 repeat-containing protein [Tolypothrix sp. NIES-4075]|uniref:WD40 domain-containing protein n=1 Tax=Tolypothrix sp. NIES-4075 TaxID=2005459 RepID=UPI000B5C48C1|nr:AAA-like domain-containing protein [Tolypothrix sp. NIES-4075]GAX41820.1 WD-40 repeat-containing protein [Tolypothrix sp. NIES-4075]
MRYQVGGSLHTNDPTYIVRQADEKLYTSLKAGDFCYVLNSRQMGKSSLLQRTSYRLVEEGCSCAYLDVTRLGSENTTPEQWYKGIILSLFYDLNLAEHVKFKNWWDMQVGISPVQKLHQFVEGVLLPNIQNDRIFIFIDEIDSLLSLNFPVNDFFAWIRHCYNQQAHDRNFQRLGFALFGVASPSDLIADKRRTPFNIGTAIELYGFQLHEAKTLLKGLEEVISQPKAVLREIIYWSGGQPFLTQKLCQLIVRTALETSNRKIVLPPETAAFWVEQFVRSHIIQHWESQDEPEHLRTIRDRLLFNEQRAGRLLGLYQQVLQVKQTDTQPPSVFTEDSQEQTELLLSGLVEKHNGILKIKNPIYESVFNAQWVSRQLDNLRPYSQTFNAWVASDYKDESRLLRGQALKDTQNWAQGKSLSDLDYQFFAASIECEQQAVQTALKAARAKEVEARLAQEKKTAKLQRFLLVAVCIGLLVSSALGLGSFTLYRQAIKSETQARNSEIEALVSSSEGLFASNRRLDALVEAIKAKRRLQKLGKPETNLERQVENALRQAVYGADEYNRFSGHTAAVMALDVSPDSSLIASASIDKTIKLIRRDGSEVATLKGHTAAVRAVDFSPDGQMLVSASEDGTVKLWKRDGQLLRTLKGHTASVWGVAFSPDGQFVASASWDTTVKLWKLDGTLLKTFKGHTASVWGVAFSPQGNIVAATSLDKTVKLWKQDGSGWQNAKLLQTLQGHTGWVVGVAFSPDGQTIASSSEDTTVILWQRDSTDGSYRQYKTLKGHSAGVWGVAFSPDGQTIATASLDKTIKLWNIDGTELRTLRGHSASVWGVTFSPDSSFIASAGAENVVRLWQKENPFQKSIIAHQAGIWSIAITSDSSTIATASHENTAKVWSRQGKLLKTFTESGGAISEASFSGDGKLIALRTYDDRIKLQKPDGTLVASYKDPVGKLLAAVLSPDGQAIAMSNVDKIAQIWHRDRPSPQILKGHQAEVWHVAFSPDGRLVGSASGDGTAKLWTLDGKLFRTLVGHSAVVWRVAFSQDGKMVATGSGDNTVKLWTLDGKLKKTLKGHTAGVWGVAFSPDGQIVASGSVDNTIKLWKVDGTELTTLGGHTAAIREITISPDGTILASGGDDNTLILWNLPRILNLDALTYGCGLVRDYLKTNAAVEKSDRSLCNNISRDANKAIGS